VSKKADSNIVLYTKGCGLNVAKVVRGIIPNMTVLHNNPMVTNSSPNKYKEWQNAGPDSGSISIVLFTSF
jgi:hypothetical protein